jgi:predicted regulator of Ras-like GTPase activity (Roadblock/LC7/MglB family)
MVFYRETLFARALEKLVGAGGYRAAYLISRTGLVWAKTAAADRQENVAALTAAAAEIFRRTIAVGLGRVEELEIRRDTGDVFTFYPFIHAGEAEEEFYIVALSAPGEGNKAAVSAVIDELKGDLEAFY